MKRGLACERFEIKSSRFGAATRPLEDVDLPRDDLARLDDVDLVASLRGFSTIDLILALNESRASLFRFDSHSASRSAAICFMVRPLLTDMSSSFFEIGFALDPVLMINQFFPPSPRMRTSVHSPFAFWPSSTRCSRPSRRALSGCSP